MRCQWWRTLIVMMCLCIPLSVSTGCGDAHMSQDEADALMANEPEEDDEAEEVETDEGDDDDEEDDL